MSISVECGHCSCWFSQEELYFCVQCSRICCPLCVTEEIVALYCPQCLESVVSSEGMRWRNRCKKCFDCPQCSAPAQYAQDGDPEAPYFFLCSFCRWNSCQSLRGASPADLAKRAMARFNGEEEEEAVTGVAVRGSLLHLVNECVRANRSHADSTPLSPTKAGYIRGARAASLAAFMSPALKRRHKSTKIFSMSDLERKDEERERYRRMHGPATPAERRKAALSDDADLSLGKQHALEQRSFTSSSSCSLAQRFSNPTQPSRTEDLLPRRRLLRTRSSKHCRTCDKLLVRPDLAPSHVMFQRRHLAVLMVPVFTIARASLHTESAIALNVRNPTSESVLIALQLEASHGDRVLMRLVSSTEDDETHGDDLSEESAARHPAIINIAGHYANVLVPRKSGNRFSFRVILLETKDSEKAAWDVSGVMQE